MKDIRELALECVERLNERIYEKGEFSEGTYCLAPFELRSSGWQSSHITFMGEVIWTDVDDPREWMDEAEEYGPLENFLWKEANCIALTLINSMGI